MARERPVELLEALVLILIGNSRHFSTLFARIAYQRLDKCRIEIRITFAQAPVTAVAGHRPKQMILSPHFDLIGQRDRTVKRRAYSRSVDGVDTILIVIPRRIKKTGDVTPLLPRVVFSAIIARSVKEKRQMKHIRAVLPGAWGVARYIAI